MSTTRITMLRNPAKAVGCPLLEGETGEVESVLASTLITMKLAEPATVPNTIRAVPNAPRMAGAPSTAPVTRESETESTSDTQGSRKVR